MGPKVDGWSSLKRDQGKLLGESGEVAAMVDPSLCLGYPLRWDFRRWPHARFFAMECTGLRKIVHTIKIEDARIDTDRALEFRVRDVR